MEEERIELSAKEGERLKILHEVERGHVPQIAAVRRLRLAIGRCGGCWSVCARLGIAGWCMGCADVPRIARFPRTPSNTVCDGCGCRRISVSVRRWPPSIRHGLQVSRETLRKWMNAAGLCQPRRRRLQQVHVWRPHRAAFGELVIMGSSRSAGWKTAAPPSTP
jgi:hypothetical protein